MTIVVSEFRPFTRTAKTHFDSFQILSAITLLNEKNAILLLHDYLKVSVF